MKCPECSKEVRNLIFYDHMCEYHGWTLAQAEEFADRYYQSSAEEDLMNIEEFSRLEKQYCKDVDIHEVCLMCQFRCKQRYSPWSGCMPPSEYCEDYELHEYWIAIMRLADKLEGS